MKQDSTNFIEIETPKKEFEYFFNDDQNKRIFFSGKFGSGKTFFLKNFFDGKCDTYDTYHLFPVRYQISSNENIVELLKYDILVELINKHPEAFQEKDAGLKESFKLFIAFCKDRISVNNILTTSLESLGTATSFSPDPLIQTVGKLGRPLSDLLAFDKEFQEFKEGQLSGEKGVVEKFIEKITTEKDPIATDHLGHLIANKIAELKSGKKSVLVLDDFDRVDPEHIFRILNVLSAHMENDEENQFKFDHIIIVGDIENIRSIFHHKYGARADFFGYFDKFFTVKPYNFDNNKAVLESIPKLIQAIKYTEPELEQAFARDGFTKLFLQEILVNAFKIDKMSLRRFLKPLSYSFPELKKGSFRRDHFSDTKNRCVDIAIKLLIAIYGSEDGFLEILRIMREKLSSPLIPATRLQQVFARSMLDRIFPHKPGQTVDSVIGDNKYDLVRSQEDDEFHLINGAEFHSQLFYDVLIEYIGKGKYIKESDHLYDVD